MPKKKITVIWLLPPTLDMSRLVTGSTPGIAISLPHRVCTHANDYSPGRFFAVNEVKMIVGHILLNYDIKLDDSKPVPDYWFPSFTSPSGPKVEICFRRRQL